jgi:hypothetical protein
MADARKLFRLFKWINEYQKTMDFLEKPPEGWDQIDIIGNILARISFAGFWAFDNLFILAKLKIIRRDSEGFKKPAQFFWWLGLLFNLVLALRKISQLRQEHASLKKTIKYFSINKKIRNNPEKAEGLKDRFSSVRTRTNACYRTILKSLGDLITSSAGWGISQKFGVNFNDGHIGFGGSVSGLITCYEQW